MPTTATMMSLANISSNRITPITAATNNISTMMPTPQSGNNSISARVNEDFAASTLSDSSADLSLSAMLNDSSFVSEIFVNTNEVAGNQPLSYIRELLSSSEITPIYVKSKNRNNFAALLVECLFDVPTRPKSNVTGRGKERLDPEIMQYIKAKDFEFYECLASEVKEEWKKCIKSIDDKSRALKSKNMLLCSC